MPPPAGCPIASNIGDRRILDIKARGKKVVVWIALSKAVAFLTTLGVGDAIEFVVDINPFRPEQVHARHRPADRRRRLFWLTTSPTTSS